MTEEKSQQVRGHPVHVTIRGQDYPITALENEDYIRQVADYVDARMAEIQSQSNVNSLSGLAILAALNIADELFVARAERESLAEVYEEKTSRILENLDKLLIDE